MKAGRLLLAMVLALSACSSHPKHFTDSNATAYPKVIAPADPAAGCDAVYEYGDEGHTHVPRGTTVPYKTEPPTSGSHMQIWGATGVYKQNAPDELLVHNLEHGHVIIWYVPGAIPSSVVQSFAELVKKNSKWALLVPRPPEKFTPRAPLAFASWRRLQRCPQPTTRAPLAAASFIDRFIKNGREKIAGDPVFETPPTR